MGIRAAVKSLFSNSRNAPQPSPYDRYYLSSASSFSFSDLRKNPTVQSCTNILANSISILPLNLYFRDPKTGARRRASWHPLYALLKRSPNPGMTPTLFINTLIRHLVQKGNAYIYIAVSGGEIVALYLLNPEQVIEEYDGRVVRYRYLNELYTDKQVLRISSLIVNDYGRGYALVDLARAAVLLGTQMDELSLSSFGNGLNTKLLIDIAEMTSDIKDLNEAQRVAQTVADYVRRNYAGAENAGKPLITWSGMKTTELKNQSSNREAELLDSRKWQEQEITKIFGVPLFLVNGTYDVKYSGLEPAMISYLNFTLSPYLRHIEQRLNMLLSPYEAEAYYFEFDYNVLLRPDEKSRAEFYAKLFTMGAIDPNGICARENIEPPSEAGGTRFVPANLMPMTDDVIAAYMASAKQKAAYLIAGKTVIDPARAAGDQAQ